MTSLPNIPSNSVSGNCAAPKSLRTQQIFQIVFNANTKLKTEPREEEWEWEEEGEGEKRKTKSAYQFVDLINERNVIEWKNWNMNNNNNNNNNIKCGPPTTEGVRVPTVGYSSTVLEVSSLLRLLLCFSLLSLLHLSLLNFFRLGNFAWVFRTIFDW